MEAIINCKRKIITKCLGSNLILYILILFEFFFVVSFHTQGPILVPILDGNLEIGALVRSNLCYLPSDFFSFMRAQHVLRYHLIQVPWFQLNIVRRFEKKEKREQILR